MAAVAFAHSSDAVAATAASPPTAPELVAPAPGHVFRVGELQVFTLRATDPDGDAWSGIIEAVNLSSGLVSTFVTQPTGSGDYAGVVAVPQLPPGPYEWRARAVDATGAMGPWSDAAAFAVGTNHPPGTPVLLAPEDGATLRRLGNPPFQFSAVDRDGDPVTGVIVIRSATSEVARIRTSPTGSGGISSGVLVTPLAEGTYTWSAQATDVHQASSGQSATRSFTVGPPPTGGGGALTGALTYPYPGLPSATGVCEPSTGQLHLESTAVFLNIAMVGYVGPVTFDGSTTSDCESALSGRGDVQLAGGGTGPTQSTLECTGLAGRYVRVGSALTMTLTGACSVNRLPLTRVTFDVGINAVPVPSLGVLDRVQRAEITGAVAVRPD